MLNVLLRLWGNEIYTDVFIHSQLPAKYPVPYSRNASSPHMPALPSNSSSPQINNGWIWSKAFKRR